MFAQPFVPSIPQLRVAWQAMLDDETIIGRYNTGLLSVEEIEEQHRKHSNVCLTLADNWTILNWIHDVVPIESTRMYAGWSGGYVSLAGRMPLNSGLRRSVHNDVVNRHYRSLGIWIHGALTVGDNQAGERHTRNIGYFPLGVVPNFARVKRSKDTHDEGILTDHLCWAWNEDDGPFIWRLAMGRTLGPHVAFEERQLLTL